MNIHDMKLHEWLNIEDTVLHYEMDLLREPNGWIYYTCNNAVFVPLHKEFAPKAEKAKKQAAKDRRDYTDSFETFWKIYPRKTGKGAAYDSWQKMGCESDSEKIIASIEAQSSTVFAGTEMRFIPLCQTWLNQERWGDDAVGDVLAPQKKVKSLNQITDEAIRAAEMDDLNYK